MMCPQGHPMNAKIDREVLSRLKIKRLSTFRYCDRCDVPIKAAEARYECKECEVDICTDCARLLLNPPKVGQGVAGADVFLAAMGGFGFGDSRQLLNVNAGDIFLCGPDRWGIHHVILALTPLTPEPHLKADLQGSPDDEVFGCETVESTQGVRGEHTHWYLTRTLFRRSRGGVVHLVADFRHTCGTLEVATTPVPVKVLLHPLRTGLDAQAFQGTVMELASESKKYGWGTGVRAFLGDRHNLDADRFPNQESRRKLLGALRARRMSRPICASVAISVWQRYFEATCRENPDMAVKNIFRYMPVYPDATTPSALVKALTKCGWVLHNSFDA